MRREVQTGSGEPPLAGRMVQELSGHTVPLLIRRGDGQLSGNPNRDLRLEAGDVAVSFGEASSLQPLDNR